MICELLKWKLPVDGGVYDQDPELMDWFLKIFAERGKHQANEQKKQEREAGRAKNNPRSKGRSPRPGKRR